MGIRFFCPNGHKLNVKSFLAGKRAICPRCGVRVLVPMESQRPSTRDSEDAEQFAARAAVAEEFSAEESPLDASADEAMLAQAREAILAASPPPPEGTSPGSPVRPPAVPTGDPIGEAPGAVWYVCPASGGRYGPASGEVILTWIRDGRIGASSLVWRDGWPEWRSAAAVFPELSQHLAAPEVTAATLRATPAESVAIATPLARPAVPAGEISGGITPLAEASRRRKRRNEISLITSAVLGVLSLILVIVLMLVFRSQTTATDHGDPPEKMPAAAPAV